MKLQSKVEDEDIKYGEVFDAKVKINKEEIVVDVENENVHSTHYYKTFAEFNEDWKDYEEPILDGVKFEQYTGLKDKNGKEIYENDIVASLTKSIKGVKPSFYSYLEGVVKYCEEDTRYYIDGSCERSDREILEKVDLTDVDNFVGNYYELEVIGNIHENPELIGEK